MPCAVVVVASQLLSILLRCPLSVVLAAVIIFLAAVVVLVTLGVRQVHAVAVVTLLASGTSPGKANKAEMLPKMIFLHACNLSSKSKERKS